MAGLAAGIVPHHYRSGANQMLEYAGRIAAHGGVAVVAIDEDEVKRPRVFLQACQVEGSRIAVQMRDVGQRALRMAMQLNVSLGRMERPHFGGAQVEGVHGGSFGSYVGSTLAAPSTNFEVAAAGPALAAASRWAKSPHRQRRGALLCG